MYLIERLTLRAGPQIGGQSLSFEPGPLTIFVGANGTGKSAALRDVESFFSFRDGYRRRVVHTQRTMSFASLDEVLVSTRGRTEGDRLCAMRYVENRFELHKVPLENVSQRLRFDVPGLFRVLGPVWCLRLDGQTRLGLARKQESGDLLELPKNPLMALFQDDLTRKRLRKLLYDAFGAWFVIDPTQPGSLRVRFSSREPEDSTEEQSLDARARAFHRAALEIDESSDGVRAMTGLMCALFTNRHRVVLIDEPEAFLHPPLARSLGVHVASLAKENEANVFVATHSAEFLMGCIQSGVPVNVVRLTYSGGQATATMLKPPVVTDMMRDPLMRSAGVLSALFHGGAVVTEAASDSALYSEINHRLVSAVAGGYDGLLFLNAQNKQTTCRIAKPLRALGVPAAIVVDMDVLKEGGTAWKRLLESAYIPDGQIGALCTFRGDLMRVFEAAQVDPKSTGGLSALKGSERESVKNLIDQLASYGIFVVPVGELEGWLSMLGAEGRKGEWLADVFSRMGADPNDPGYVSPEAGDVWDFVRSIAAWVRNPSRSGMGSA